MALNLNNVNELRSAAAEYGVEITVEQDGKIRRETIELRDVEVLRGKLEAQRRQQILKENTPGARQLTVANAYPPELAGE